MRFPLFISVFVSVLVLFGCSSVSNQIAKKEKLIKGIESTRKGLESFKTSHSMRLLTKAHGGEIVFDEKKVWMDTARLRVEHTFGAPPGAEEQFHVITTVNDAGATKHFGWNGREIRATTVTADFHSELEWQSGLFEFMLYDPFSRLSGRANQYDLSELIRSNQSRLRPSKERIGEFNCRVVDFFFEENEYPYLSVWIDESHGYIPVLQRFYVLKAVPAAQVLPGEKTFPYVRCFATFDFLLSGR